MAVTETWVLCLKLTLLVERMGYSSMMPGNERGATVWLGLWYRLVVMGKG